jgi:ribulose-bisphosphate carboxylase large chain
MDGCILATYHISAPMSESRARADALAVEQSVEVPLDAIRDERIRAEILARVASIRPSSDGFDVVLEIATATTGHEISQLMNMLFGNCSLHPEVELADVQFPERYCTSFRGPRFGIAGIRECTGAHGRALTCTAIKPQGSTIDQLSELARTFVRAGIDVIKDDHGLANQAFSPFAERVPAIQRAVDQANGQAGGRACYAPTLSGGPQALLEQLRISADCGVAMVLVAPMLVGLPVFGELADRVGVPILAHPAFAGASRIAPPLLVGRLFRLLGADATIFPNHGGRFSYGRDTCLAIARAAREPWEGFAPVLPVPAGGMTLARVDDVIEEYGIETMLLIGGGLLTAGDALLDHSRAFVERVARHRSHT